MQDIVHFLVDKPAYQVKEKMAKHYGLHSKEEMRVRVEFSAQEKANCITRTAEIWEVSVI